jgi:hypothetical protein
MTYAEARDNALYLIHQESIAGVKIPGVYNNQQDYLDKIPGLINAAQMDLATTTKPIPAEVMLGELVCVQKGSQYLYKLPEDLWQRRGSGILVPRPCGDHRGGGYMRFNHCRMIGNDKLVLPMCAPKNSILEYYRYPIRLQAKPEDDDRLDNVPEAQEAVPYYVAAHLVMYDDAFLYATLYNEYTAKKNAMQDLPRTEMDTVEDVYMEFDADYHFWG